MARLFAIIVLYKIPPAESSTLRTLLAAIDQVDPSAHQLEILLQDNTPGGQHPGELPSGVSYEAFPSNPGLAHAYNRGAEKARVKGCNWLLTLDQDTVLPIDFIARIGRLATEFESSPVVTAIVPQVVGDNRAISPFKFVAESFPRPFNPGYTGCPSQGTYAINSAAMLRLDALAQVGGYDPLFPLDISDLYLFHRLHLAGKKVYIAGDVVVHHELGLLKKHKRMNMERYRAVLLDECAFWDMYRGPVARLERMIRLAGRVCKDTLNREDRAYRRETLKEFKRRLLTRRARRVDDWRKWAGARMMSQLTLSNGVGRDEPANQ